MREMIKPGLILLLITVIAAVALGGVNSVTKDVIIKNQLEAKNKAMAELLPEASAGGFSENVDVNDNTGVVCYNIGYKNANQEIAGYIISVETKGYGGTISLLVAVDASGVTKGISIIKHNETPGLGANAQKESFLSQYIGKSGELSVTKNAVPKDDEIDAITSATITSKSVTRGVNAALAFFKENLEGR